MKKALLELKKFYASSAVCVLGPKQNDCIQCGFYLLDHVSKSLNRGNFDSICDASSEVLTFPNQTTLRAISQNRRSISAPIYEGIDTRNLFDETFIKGMVKSVVTFTSSAIKNYNDKEH